MKYLTILVSCLLHHCSAQLRALQGNNPTPYPTHQAPKTSSSTFSSEVMENKKGFLASSFPKATESELERFLSREHGDVGVASVKIQKYLEWRVMLDTDEVLKKKENIQTDEECWSLANELAIGTGGVKLPKYISEQTSYDPNRRLTSKDNERVFTLYGGMIDLDIAPSKAYSDALAIYLDLNLPRESDEKISVLVDVRGGPGWKNHKAPELVDWGNEMGDLFDAYFPERLGNCFIYPVDKKATALWSSLTDYFEPENPSKFQLLSGSSSRWADSPQNELSKYFDEETLYAIEDHRWASFGDEDPDLD